MFSTNLKKGFFATASFYLIAVFLANNMVLANEWECDGIRGNMNTLKISSDPEGLLEGPECDTQVKSGGGGEQGKRAYVMQATDGAMSLSYYLDISSTIIGEGAVVDFMQLESGTGNNQALLLDVQLTRIGGDVQLLVDWYQPSNTPAGVILVQSDTLDISNYAVNNVVTINFDWDNGIASLSVFESGAASMLIDLHLYSPRIFHIGVIDQVGVNAQGLLYRFYDTEINLIN